MTSHSADMVSSPGAWRTGSPRAVGRTAIRLVGIVVLVVVTLAPFLYVVSNAFKDSRALFSYPPEWIPSDVYFGNFANLLDAGFPSWLARTLAIAGISTVAKLLFDSMAAYAFARLRFPGRRVIFALMVVTVMIPPVALIIPLYFLVRDLDGLGTYWALLIPPMANPIGILMLRGFIETLPVELLQAARVDGATPLRTFTSVVLPVIRPGLVVVGLYTFLLSYTNFVWPLVIAPDLPVLTTGLAGLKPLQNPDWGLLSAGALATMVPITIVFLAFQRAFIAPSLSAAVKG